MVSLWSITIRKDNAVNLQTSASEFPTREWLIDRFLLAGAGQHGKRCDVEGRCGSGFTEELASPPVEVPIHLLLSYERRTDHKFLRLHFRCPKNNSFCFVDEIASCKASQQKRGSSLFDFALLLHTDSPLFAQLGFPFSFPLLGYFSSIF